MTTVTSFLAEITAIITAIVGWVGDFLALFLQPPMILFVGFAAASAAYAMASRLVPKKRR